MKLTTNILVQQFIESLDEEWDKYSDEEINDIVRANWEYIAKQMSSGNVPVIRQKFFGTFIPYPARVKGMLEKLNKKFKGKETEDYFEMKNNLEKYLENVE